jgi:hypothetical protein
MTFIMKLFDVLLVRSRLGQFQRSRFDSPLHQRISGRLSDGFEAHIERDILEEGESRPEAHVPEVKSGWHQAILSETPRKDSTSGERASARLSFEIQKAN